MIKRIVEKGLMTIRDQVFLYCFLLYEGQDQGVLSLLPEERSKILLKEAKRYDRFPKEVKLTLVTKLLGYLVQHVRNRHLERVHSTWVANALEKESSKIITIILNRVSPDYRKKVLENFSKTYAMSNPYVLPNVADAIYQIFCSRFAPMSAPWGASQLTLETLYLVKEEELYVFLRHVGVQEIARASAIAGKNAMAALVVRFPPDLQDEFLNGIKSARGDQAEKQKLSAKRLSRIDMASMSMEESTLRAGLIRLAACFKTKKETAERVAQRLPLTLGMVLLEAREEVDVGADEEAELLAILHDLIQREKIDKQYVDSLFSSASRARPSGITA